MEAKTKSEQRDNVDSEASSRMEDILSAITMLKEESAQIGELSELERQYATETINYIKKLIEPLNTSFHIDPHTVMKGDGSITDIVLTPQGTICLVKKENVVSKPLESLQTETLVNIIQQVLPEIKDHVASKREKMTSRVNMLERVAKELKKVGPVGPKQKATIAQPSSPKNLEIELPKKANDERFPNRPEIELTLYPKTFQGPVKQAPVANE
ncbi:MAG TPA: hypothetical protein VJN71_09480 [Nitrososphaerales archaeon]|nr:hypothetical protein [Nitrososphaerales archaeon]